MRSESWRPAYGLSPCALQPAGDGAVTSTGLESEMLQVMQALQAETASSWQEIDDDDEDSLSWFDGNGDDDDDGPEEDEDADS